MCKQKRFDIFVNMYDLNSEKYDTQGHTVLLYIIDFKHKYTD